VPCDTHAYPPFSLVHLSIARTFSLALHFLPSLTYTTPHTTRHTTHHTHTTRHTSHDIPHTTRNTTHTTIEVTLSIPYDHPIRTSTHPTRSTIGPNIDPDAPIRAGD